MQASESLGDFLDYFWGTEIPTGELAFVYVPVKVDPTDNRTWKSFMFEWPRQKAAVVRHILKWSSSGADTYFAPALFKKNRPTKDSVLGSWVLWADLDGNAPESWIDLDVPKPTLIVQSSLEHHEHVYWLLDEFLDDVELLEDRNRAIAYALKADTSGWDADQVLRPIETTNFKRGLPVYVKDWDL